MKPLPDPRVPLWINIVQISSNHPLATGNTYRSLKCATDDGGSADLAAPMRIDTSERLFLWFDFFNLIFFWCNPFYRRHQILLDSCPSVSIAYSGIFLP